MPGQGSRAPVFSEPTGRRWQRVRLGAILVSAASTLVVVGLIAAALLPPSLPATNAFRSGAHPATSANTAEAERRRAAARDRLRRSLNPVRAPARANPSAPRPKANIGLPGDSLLAAFYVNWDDNSLSALKAHADHLDWVIAEWGFVAPGGDSVKVAVDTNAMDFIEKIPADRRPSVLLMVTNVTEGVGRFGGSRGARLLGDSVRRRTAARKLASEVRRYGLAGVTVDFEEVAE